MDVHKALRKGLDQHRGDDPHPAGHHHQLHPCLPKGLDQGAIERFAAAETAVIKQAPGNPKPLRPLDRAAARLVHHQQLHAGVEGPVAAAGHQGLKVRPVA